MSIYSVAPQSNARDDSLLKANSAEKEANHRIASANERVQEAEHESNKEIELIRDEYEKQSMVMGAKQESALESQRNKGYESIRDLKRIQQSDNRRVNREGESESSKLQEHYKNLIYKTGRSGEEQLRDLQSQQHRQVEYDRKMNQVMEEDLKNQFKIGIEELRRKQEDQTSHLTTENKEEYERKKEESTIALEEAEKKIDDRLQKTLKLEKEQIGKVENQATYQIKEIRQDTADKLAAYSSRQRDPFYKLMKVQADLHEDSDSYILTARIPVHEQDHVSASVKGDNLVVTGYRRNEEFLEVQPGHTQGTSSFQSYHESFPLNWPVDSHRMTREFIGDRLIVRVPKKNQYAFKEPEKPKPEKVKVEPPHFPKNIPHIQHDKTKGEDEETKAASRNSGSGTLS